ncbi:helix-turn-helix transcriptional regulator [Serratia nevei]|uniref:helix-turn-helix transcriptional regulator n=1 Tax=Serratia nevei TaxID=2703794 RepID=UPI0030190B45
MKTVNIIIDDENLYFAAGLRHSITEYAQANKKNICFLAPDVGAPADVVLASSCRRTQRWRSVGAAPVVMIKERPLAADCALQRVLYRTDSRQRLFELLGEALVARHSLVRSPKQTLTCRERQVIGHLRRGLDQSQTARVMGVSVKTVHSHKRSVMQKMLLSRSHEFMYWLLSQEEEYS